MAPRQAPSGVQARGGGPVQGHHRGLRGAAGPAGEQGGGVRRARRREESHSPRRQGPRRRRGGVSQGGAERKGRRRALHAGAGGAGRQDGVQRLQQRRRRPGPGPGPARARRVLQLRGAQGAAAGAEGGVHPRGALQRVRQGGQVHPRRRHQERTDHQGGGDADRPCEARDAERRDGDAGGRRRRAAGLPGGRRHVRHLREEAPAVQAARRRPGAQGPGAAGRRAHRVAALVQAARRRQVPVRVPGRGHLPRVRQGRQGRRHARRRRGQGRARGPRGQVRRRVPGEPHGRAAEGARRHPEGLRMKLAGQLKLRPRPVSL